MNCDILINIMQHLDIKDILTMFTINKDYYKINNNNLLWLQLIQKHYYIYNIKTCNKNTYIKLYEFEKRLFINNVIQWSVEAVRLMYRLYDDHLFPIYVKFLNDYNNKFMTDYQIIKILYKTPVSSETLNILDKYCKKNHYINYYKMVTGSTYVNNEHNMVVYKDMLQSNVVYCYKLNDKIMHKETNMNYFLMTDLFMEILEQRKFYNNKYQIMLLEVIDEMISNFSK